MKGLIFIAIVSSVVLVKCHDNVAMESYQSSYKVHPDPQDSEEQEEDIHSQTLYGKLSDLEGGEFDHFNVRQSLKYAGDNEVKSQSAIWPRPESHAGSGPDLNSVHRPYASTYHSNLKFPTRQESLQHHHHYHHHHHHRGKAELVSQQQYGTEGIDSSLDQNSQENESEPASGFSSVVEHVTENDGGYYSNEHEGSTGDIKRIVPKSTVYFKMYHSDKGGNPVKTDFHSNVLHENSPGTATGIQGPSQNTPNAYAEHYEPEENTKTYNHPPHYMTKVQIDPEKVNFKLKPQTTAKEFLFNNHENHIKTTPDSKEPEKFKIHIPSQSSNDHIMHHQQNHFYQNQQRKPPGKEGDQHFSPIQSVGQYSDAVVGQKPETTGPSRRPKIVKYVQHGSVSKDKHRGPQGTKISSHSGHRYAVTEDEPGLESESAISESAQKAVPSTISNSLSPWKTYDYSKKLAKFQNPWKTFNEIPLIKSIDFQHSFSHLPLVYKPADTFHFEVNPFIDIGENDQESFDHQKALEGSTSFDIKHAIGSGNEGVSLGHQFTTPSKSIVTTKTIKSHQVPSHLVNQQALYSSPSHKVLPTPSFLPDANPNAKDSLSLGSETVQPTPAAMFEVDNKYLLQPQVASALMASSLKQKSPSTVTNLQENPIRLHFPTDQQLAQHLKPKKHSTSLFSTFPKMKKYLKPYKEASWENLIHDVHFKQPKKNKHFFLQTQIHPSQKLFPVVGDDWTLHKGKIRTGKSNKFVIKTSSMPYITDFEKNLLPVFMKSSQKRIHREVSGGLATPKIQPPVAVSNSEKRGGKSGRKSANLEGTPNEFSVSASYKIDRSLRKDSKS